MNEDLLSYNIENPNVIIEKGFSQTRKNHDSSTNVTKYNDS